jgi:hypothetical protein
MGALADTCRERKARESELMQPGNLSSCDKQVKGRPYVYGTRCLHRQSNEPALEEPTRHLRNATHPGILASWLAENGHAERSVAVMEVAAQLINSDRVIEPALRRHLELSGARFKAAMMNKSRHQCCRRRLAAYQRSRQVW